LFFGGQIHTVCDWGGGAPSFQLVVNRTFGGGRQMQMAAACGRGRGPCGRGWGAKKAGGGGGGSDGGVLEEQQPLPQGVAGRDVMRGGVEKGAQYWKAPAIRRGGPTLSGPRAGGASAAPHVRHHRTRAMGGEGSSSCTGGVKSPPVAKPPTKPSFSLHHVCLSLQPHSQGSKNN